MKFNELEQQMRSFEKEGDVRFAPSSFIVARLDGRSFTKLTSDIWKLEKPFDRRFSEAMARTAAHLCKCGFEVVYAYTQSDEISLLLSYDSSEYDRKTRKFLSILSGEASSFFTKEFGQRGVFDCRLVCFPSKEKVVDYFRWRQADSMRNALSLHLYWKLRSEGIGPTRTTEILSGMGEDEKVSMLFDKGVRWENVPPWQKYGIGVYPEKVKKTGIDPRTGEKKEVERTDLKIDQYLPTGEKYGKFIFSLAADDERVSLASMAKKDRASAPTSSPSAPSVQPPAAEPSLTDTQEWRSFVEECTQAGDRIITSCARSIILRLNKEQKQSSNNMMDEFYLAIGMNYTDQLSVKKQNLSYAEFEFGFELRLDEMIDEQIKGLSPEEKLILRGRDIPALSDGEAFSQWLFTRIKDAFGSLLDEHYNTARMRNFLQRHDWI